MVDFKELKKPFDPSDIEWRIARKGSSNGKPWAMVLAYVTNRAIMDRLDDVVGNASWYNTYAPGPLGGVVCGISIDCGGKWVTKWDGADNTNIEGVKGGLSDSMKRAAVQWGIGRYLYNLKETFADCEVGKKRGDLWKYVPEDKKNSVPAFSWAIPSLPQWAIPSKSKNGISENKVDEITSAIMELHPTPEAAQKYTETIRNYYNVSDFYGLTDAQYRQVMNAINEKLKGDK